MIINTYKILVRKPEAKIKLGRLWSRQNNIKIDLRENGGRIRTGFIWFKTGIRARLLRTR
jgi:hypothetical protein